MGDERTYKRQSRGGRASSRRLTAALASAVVLASLAVLPIAGATTASSAKIRYTKQTVFVPTSTIKRQLLLVSKNGATYTFKTKQGVLRKIKAGSVMLLQHMAVREVTKTARTHRHFVVSTKPATLTDLVANGTLSWNKSINFANGFGLGGSAVPPDHVARAARGTASVPAMFGMVPMATSGGITLKGSTHSYKYSASFTKSGNAVAVSISISKSSPIDLEAKITGTLDNLTTAGNIAVNKGTVSNAKMLANHLKGHFTLSYSAKPISGFSLGNAGGIKISLPAELAVPFFVGPVPFFLGINVAFFASAGFSGFDQKLSGSYTFNYDGEGGFSTAQSGATSGVGVLKGLGDIVLKAANAVKNGPLSFTFGAQMPQIELGLGAKGLNVAGNITLIGSTGIATYGSGCDTRQMEVEGTAGAEASFFGFSADAGSATLFDKTVDAAYPAGCGVFPNGSAVRALGR